MKDYLQAPSGRTRASLACKWYPLRYASPSGTPHRSEYSKLALVYRLPQR